MIRLNNSLDNERLEKIKALYLRAFPKEERKPFDMMLKKSDEGSMEIFAIEDENKDFCGLAIFVYYKNLVLLDYLAIDENKRGQGIGSQAIKAIKERFIDKTLFLEIESTKAYSSNQTEKERRKAFYLRNGLKPLDYEVNLFNVRMELLTFNNYISFKEYYLLYEVVFGKVIAGYKTSEAVTLI